MAEGIEPYFLIKGFIGSLPVSATWNGGYLMADTELLEVADILIRGASSSTWTRPGQSMPVWRIPSQRF